MLLIGGGTAGLVWLPRAIATPALNFNSVVLVRTFFDKMRITTQHGDDGAHRPTGGNSGGHTHPGPSIVAVKTGVATVHDGAACRCVPLPAPRPAPLASGEGVVAAQ